MSFCGLCSPHLQGIWSRVWGYFGNRAYSKPEFCIHLKMASPKAKKSQNNTANPFVLQWPIKACPAAIPPSEELTGAIPSSDLLCSLLTALKLLVTPSVLQSNKEGSTTPSSCMEENVVFYNCTAFKCACSIPREYLRYPLSICVYMEMDAILHFRGKKNMITLLVFWIKMKLLKSLQYQNPLFVFDASIVTSGVAVLLLKGILSLLFWLDSRFGWQFQGYSLFIFLSRDRGDQS